MYVVCSPQLLAVYVFAVSFRIRPNASSSLSISRGLLLLSVEPWREWSISSGPFSGTETHKEFLANLANFNVSPENITGNRPEIRGNLTV